MGMPVSQQRWTAEQVRALIDESRHWPRYELIDGELLVSPAPRLEHQRCVTLLWRRLADYVHPRSLGEVFTSPADIELEPGTIAQPDVFVVPLVEGRRPRAWPEVRSLLAVEVLSPSTVRFDRVRKRRFFARMGVPEYWVVDLDARVVERWCPGDERPDVLDERLEWMPAGAAEGWTLELPLFFGAVHGEGGE